MDREIIVFLVIIIFVGNAMIPVLGAVNLIKTNITDNDMVENSVNSEQSYCIGDAVASFTLNSSNTHPWGLANNKNFDQGPLYVSDCNLNRIFAYDLEDINPGQTYLKLISDTIRKFSRYFLKNLM